MSLTNVSPLGFILGLAALAGILFAIQRLLVRHREVVVVTTLFWREALEEQRARTLVERFRQPLTYLLLLALAGLMWLGVARPDAVRAEGERHVLLLDASAVMEREGRFDLAKDALAEALADSPRDRTEVILCGAYPRTLLAPGEDRALLASRLEGAAPEATPSSLESAMGAAITESAGSALRFTVFGDGHIGDLPDLPDLPGGSSVELAPLPSFDGPSRGIVAVGLAPAASGAWDRVDATFEIAGPAASDPEVLVGGAPVTGLLELPQVPDRGARYALRDLMADGGTLEVRLAQGDGLSADDAASITLPDRPRIRVYVAQGADVAALSRILALDPAVEMVSAAAEADVIVGDGPGNRPSLRILPASAQEEAILVTFDGDMDAQAALSRAVGELGLDRIDGAALAEAIGRPIAVGARPGDLRQVAVWDELLGSDVSFARSRSLPVLVGRAVRWLADVEPIVPYSARGRAIPARAGTAPSDLRLAGMDAPLLDRRTTTGLDDLGRSTGDFDVYAPQGPASPGPWRPYTWFLVLALALLGVEWVLFSRGRIA